MQRSGVVMQDRVGQAVREDKEAEGEMEGDEGSKDCEGFEIKFQ